MVLMVMGATNDSAHKKKSKMELQLWALSYGQLNEHQLSVRESIFIAEAKYTRLRIALETINSRMNWSGQYPNYEAQKTLGELQRTTQAAVARALIDLNAARAILADIQDELQHRDPPTHWKFRNGARRYGNNPRSLGGL
jgi:hypothetical protein